MTGHQDDFSHDGIALPNVRCFEIADLRIGDGEGDATGCFLLNGAIKRNLCSLRDANVLEEQLAMIQAQHGVVALEASAFAGLMGQRVAAPGVTVLDDGTIPDRRGSITIDDEGTPSGRNVLIEDGILVGYMQDRQNARLMGARPTGNGRRESFAHIPMPRMTNTYMLGGTAEPGAIVADVRDGIYAVGFGGGQVDITNGKFVFSCTEAYRVRNGVIGEPVKGATLIGDGATALKNIRAIGNDMALDPGIGNCGKAGQWVPVGVGQPTLLMGGLTVGGSAT